MAIKKVTFSFDVPITQLLGLIATGNAGMRIDVYGDDKAHAIKHLAGPKVAGLLEPPTRKRRSDFGNRGKLNGSKITAYEIIARAVLADPGHRIDTKTLHPIFEQAGLARNSISPQVHVMYAKGYLHRSANGQYSMTKSGFKHFTQRGFTAPRDEKGSEAAS